MGQAELIRPPPTLQVSRSASGLPAESIRREFSVSFSLSGLTQGAVCAPGLVTSWVLAESINVWVKLI